MNIRSFLPAALVLALSVGSAYAIDAAVSSAGVAYAQSTIDAGSSSGSDVPRETVGSGLNQTGSGSATVVTVTEPKGSAATVVPPPSTAVVVTQPIITADDASLIVKLWKNGAILAGAIVLLFVGLTAGAKLDRKRAWLYSSGLAGVGILYEVIQRGGTPTGSMFVVALSMIVATYVKGPAGDLPAPPKA